MTAINQIHSQLFGQRKRVMRSFASDKGIYSFFSGFLDLSAGASSENSHATHFDGAAWANPYFPAKDPSQPIDKFGPINLDGDRNPEVLPLVEKKGFRCSELKGTRQLNIISDFGMQIQRQMRTVDGKIGRNGALEFAELSTHHPS